MTGPVFQHGNTLLVRAPLHYWDDTVADPTADPSTDDPYTVESLTEFLRRPRHALFEEALEVSSPALTRTLRRVAAGTRLKPGEIRRAAFSLARYQIRAASRCTPFGLLAGVGLLHLDEKTKIVHGDEHLRIAGPDLGWLMGVIRQLESRPGIRSRLRVQANNLAMARGNRLTLAAPMDARDGSGQRSVRYTSAVRLAMETAMSPVPYATLLTDLATSLPEVPSEALGKLLGQLVEWDFLLTELRPPPDHPDPLGHVLALVPEADELTDVASALAQYSRHSVRHSNPDLARTLIERLRNVPTRADIEERGDYFSVDVRMDVEGTLATAVGEQLAAAAEALWRIAPDDTAPGELREYHQQFIERYGVNQAVPLLDLLDPERGLGAPAGYRHPTSGNREPSSDTYPQRDAVLAELALTAVRAGEEVVLDETTIARLATTTPEAMPPRGLDLIAELVARDGSAIDEGDFQLVLVPWSGSPAPGASFGRFAHMFGGAPLLREIADEEPGDRIVAHLSYTPRLPRMRNLAKTARWLPNRVVVGAFGSEHPTDIPLADLAVFADSLRLRVLCISRATEIDVLVHHMLDPRRGAPNIARFLQEITATGRREWAPWQWGSLTQLPALPRVRYRRTVLCPARWRCVDPQLKDRSLTWRAWEAAFHRWRAQWSVPDLVRVGSTDKRLRLDLSRQWHRRLLRSEIDNVPDQSIVLHEDLTQRRGAGWLHERADVAEVALVLRSTAAPETPSPPPPVRYRSVPHLPGGEWLYAKLYCNDTGQRALLANALSAFVADLPPGVAEWFFIRYRDPEPHLRIRVHGEPSTLSGPVLTRLNTWASTLVSDGLARRLELASYEPEYERYGDEELMPLAHRVFTADSELAVDLLNHGADQHSSAAWVTAAVSASDIINAMLSATSIDPVEWVLAQIDKDEDLQSLFREKRQEMLRSGPPTLGQPPSIFSQPTLTHLWQTRFDVLRQYGAEVYRKQPSRIDNILHSVLHMHHNRLIGIDPDSERSMYAACRGWAQIQQGRRQAGL